MSHVSSSDLYAAARDPVIETLHGWFDPGNPVFDINDIAHTLGMKCRFNGHCKRFYSVAEHSVLVSRLMEELGGDPREGLGHDGNETYGPDVSSPQKQLFPDLRAYEDRVDKSLRMHLGLPLEKTSECKRADNIAVLIEAFVLMRSRGEGPHWCALDSYRADTNRLRVRPEFQIRCLDPEAARVAFLHRYQELST